MAKWTDDQVQTLRRMWLDGKGSGMIARAVGKTRNATMGMINRQGLMGQKGAGNPDKIATPAKPAQPIKQAPVISPAERAKILKSEIAGLYQDDVDPDDIEIIQVLAGAAVFETVDPLELSEILEIDEDIIFKIHDDMLEAGLWTRKGPGDLSRYEGKEGYLQFILECMLYEGHVKHSANGWYSPDAFPLPQPVNKPAPVLQLTATR